jgi:hypothetical protein
MSETRKIAAIASVLLLAAGAVTWQFIGANRAAPMGNVVRICGLRNHADGAEGIRTPDLCSAIAALST